MAIDWNQETTESRNGISFNRLFWTLKQHVLVIGACVIFGLLLSYLFVSFVPPKYKASAQVLFDPGMGEFVKSDPGFLPGILTAKALERAIALIQSPAILKKVGSKLMARPVPDGSAAKTAIRSILSGTTESEDARLRHLITWLQKSIAITTEAADQVIIVSYQSESPQEAADLANLIASTFVEDRNEARRAILSQATGWLDERVSEARSRLMDIDKKIHTYKSEHKIEGDTGSSEYEGQLAHLRQQRALVQDKLSSAESFENALKSYSQAGHVDYRSLGDTLNDPALEKLRSSLTEMEGQAAAARAKYGSYHPEVRAKEVQTQVIRREIEAAAKRKADTAAKELEALRYEQRDMDAKAEALRLKANELKAAEVQLHELQREREAVRTLYESTLARLTQMAPQQSLTLSEFRVIIDAAVPEHPKIPPILIWFAGGMFGLVLGAGISLLLTSISDSLVHPDDVEKSLAVRLLASVPLLTNDDLEGAETSSKSPGSHFLEFAKEFPNSLFTNCLAGAKILLSGNNADDASSVIMITSPLQGDGKTHISSNLASLSTLVGEKTLLIDLDSRKPRALGREVNRTALPKISVFLDKTNLSEHLIATTSEAGFDIVRPASFEGVAWLKLFQPQIRELLDLARTEYKQVWVDTPPVQMFTDALVLARRVDGVVIVAEWSKTTRRQVLDTRAQIIRSGGQVLGLIINKMEVHSLISPYMADYKSYYNNQSDTGMLERNLGLFFRRKTS